METVNVIVTGIQLPTVLSIVEHAGRTAHRQMVIVILEDVMDQLNMTASNVLKIPTVQSTDTVPVTKIGEILLMELPVALIPETVITDVQVAVLDLPIMIVLVVLNMLVEHHVYVMPTGEDRTVSTTMTNVILDVTDVQDQQTLTVPVVYQMQNVMLMEIVSANLVSGNSKEVKLTISVQDLSTVIVFAHTETKTTISVAHVTDQDVDTVMNV
jgi:hypothetical protein